MKAHRRTVTVMCMVSMIRSNSTHPLRDALHLPYVPERVTRGSLIAHRHSFTPPRCRAALFLRSFAPLSVSLWDDLDDLTFYGAWLAGFKSRVNVFFWPDLFSLFVFQCLIFFFLRWLVVRGLGVFGQLIESLHSLPALHSWQFLIMILLMTSDIINFNWMLIFRITQVNAIISVIIGSDDLIIYIVTFDSKMIFEKNLRSVQNSFSMTWYLEEVRASYSMIDLFLGDAFRVLSCPFWSTVLLCGAWLPIHTLNYWTQSVVPAF